MITLSVNVKMSDGSGGTYPVTPRVQVDFERRYKTTIIAAFSSDPSIEHLCWLGWAAMKNAGEVVKLFDEWLDQVDSVEPDVGDAVPLAGGALPAPSPSSS